MTTQIEMFEPLKDYFTVTLVSNVGGQAHVSRVKYHTYEEASSAAHNTIAYFKDIGVGTVFVSVTKHDGTQCWSYEVNKTKET
jgi:hypothetical protein